jgi:hypothetical protein
MTATIWPGAYAYQYSRVQAEANFTAGHIYLDKTTSPWTRYWDYNHNGVVDIGEKEAAVIVFTWRSTEYCRSAGVQLYQELLAMNFTVPVGMYPPPPPAKIGGERNAGTNYQQVMLDKNYHITTLGWVNVGPDPDFLYDLYHVSSFWDDAESGCPNTADLNDTVLNHFEEMIKFNTTSGGAIQSAYKMQERFLDIAAQIPLYSSAAYSASRKWYSGGNGETIVTPDDGENIYRGKEWLHLCAQQGLGSNSWFSYLNGYPNGSLYGNGFMTIRYGWREQRMPQHINPFYSDSYWDAIILDAIYDTPGYRNPYDLTEWKPLMIENWGVGTWLDQATATTKSKVTLTLRPDMKWADGIPITIADVVFSLVEAGPLMISRGFSPPWWWPTGALVKSLYLIDAYNVEILYNVQSYLVQSWTLGGIYVVPKHIWKPIILSPSGPTGFAPDPNIIGSGPWRYKSFTALSSLIVVANKPGSTVQTDRPGAVPITSPGYYNYYPIHVSVHVTSPTPYAAKLNTETFPLTVGLEVDMKNRDWMDSLVVNKYIYVDGVLQGGFPVDKTISPDATDVETLTVNLAKGRHTVKVAVHTKGPSTIFNGMPGGQANPWLSHWDNVTLWIYVTKAEDITGSTFYDDIGLGSYPYKTELPTPDGKVDMADIIACSKAFGTVPGDPKWFSPADIDHDYNVGLDDYTRITHQVSGPWYLPPKDVYITKINLSRNFAYQGFPAKVNVTVENRGTLTQTFSLCILFSSALTKTSLVTLSGGESKTVTLDVFPRAFLFEEISRTPGGKPLPPPGIITLTGTGTFLNATTGTVTRGSDNLNAGIIKLYYSNGTLKRRWDLIMPGLPNVFTAGNYSNGLYVLGTAHGELCFLDDTGESGLLTVGAQGVADVRIEGSYVNATTTSELVRLKRISPTFALSKGNYTIAAYTDLVQGSYSTTNNTVFDGSVTVRLTCDINNDGKVELKDVYAVAKAYGSERKSDGLYWHTPPRGCCPHSPGCDINDDGKIELKDYYATCKNYGKTDP